MTTRPVRSIIDDQLDDLVMPHGADHEGRAETAGGAS